MSSCESNDSWSSITRRTRFTQSGNGPAISRAASPRSHRALRPRPRASQASRRYRISRDEYLDRIRECLSFIAAGESYEICLTNKVLLESRIAALDYYETLRTNESRALLGVSEAGRHRGGLELSRVFPAHRRRSPRRIAPHQRNRAPRTRCGRRREAARSARSRCAFSRRESHDRGSRPQRSRACVRSRAACMCPR